MRRLLFVSYVQPLTPFSGFTYRTVNILRWLGQRYDVNIVYEGCETEQVQSYVPLDLFNRIIAVPTDRRLVTKIRGIVGASPYHHALHSSPAMQRVITELLRTARYDMVWLNKSVHYPILEHIPSLPPIIVDQHAAEPSVWDNLIRSDPRWYVRWYSRWNKWKALRYERKVYVHVAGTIAISPADAAVMLMHFPHIKRQVIVPQGVDTAYYTPNSDIVADPDLLLFSGTAATRNVQAMERLVNGIMPLVHKQRPGMRVLWIGSVDRANYAFLGKPWVETTGFVNHVPPYFDRGAIYVSPFYMGEGMKTKVVEAMAMGKVIVATPIGLAGVEGAERLPFVRVGSSDEELANAILKLRDRSDLAALGLQAREYAIEHYAWDRVLAPLQPFLEACMRS